MVDLAYVYARDGFVHRRSKSILLKQPKKKQEVQHSIDIRVNNIIIKHSFVLVV